MRKNGGMTIVQMMVVIGLLGLVLYFAVNTLIDARCEDAPNKEMCQNRNPKSAR